MNADEIRKRFLEFFKKKGHVIVPSDLLVPENDPTLLFTGAGMNQFKDQFMGKNITYKRAASSQKCIRTADVENVGKTPRHHTFFEMLGNFSFGDYFKREAILWGWEFMTKEMNIPEEKLWASVYEKDEESFVVWRDEVKVPEEKIVKLGAEDNFWPANAPEKGPNGPCGPCSEIFYDWGEKLGCGKKGCSPACDCGRFVEVWNLVFTEFERKSDGSLVPLPNKNIDTGMGLERIAAVKQGTYTNFGTDLFTGILTGIKKELGSCAEKVPENEVYLIADHLRAAVFAISDGVSPSNEKQGYVIRKLIRRAYLRGKAKGEPFLFNVVLIIADRFKETYPDIYDKREHIAAIVKEEEKRFEETLRSGMPVMDNMLSGNKKMLTGDKIFKLVDTYGMPLEVIKDICDKRGLDLDVEGFTELMETRKEESRKESDMSCDFIFKPDSFNGAPKPSFSDKMPLDVKLDFILKSDEEAEILSEGDCAELITSPQSSVLYAESGGQVGDTGTISKPGARMDIINTVASDGRKVLFVTVEKGSFSKGDKVTLEADSEKKKRTASNHTATHLLQAALREVLGESVKQSGSFVNNKRLRFDFTHMKKLSTREIVKIEDIVNEWVGENIDVCKEEKALNDAKAEGALSFFGEKYGDKVRVVTVGTRSKELCGGTHVDNTRDIGIIKITGESSIASGVRRIEAVTGPGAENWIKEHLSGILGELEDLSEGKDLSAEGYEARNIIDGKTEIDAKLIHDLEERIIPALSDKLGSFKRAAKKKQKEQEADVFSSAREKADGFASKAEILSGIKFISGVLENTDMSVLRKTIGYLCKKTDPAVVLLGGSKDGKAYLLCAADKSLIDKGISAQYIVDSVAGEISGGGGGNPSFAQAGGKDPEGLEKAIKKAKEIIKRTIDDRR
ncbi:MAG: alanine--tRNA ligase [Candidatus Omnitrophota bacterium]